MKCGACGQEMHFDGYQDHPMKAVKFGLHTCHNEACERYGRAMSDHEYTPFSDEELAAYGPLYAALGVTPPQPLKP